MTAIAASTPIRPHIRLAVALVAACVLPLVFTGGYALTLMTQAAVMILFALSYNLLYGLTGTTNIPSLSYRLFILGPDVLVSIAFVMVIIGFGFKLAATPFHLWSPDVYQGAPLPCAAFIASGSKVAGSTVSPVGLG